MGVEVKGAGDGVVIADRGCNDYCNRNSGWGSGWGAVGGALVGKSLTTVSLRKEVFAIWVTKLIRISEILVTKWAQASTVLWIVSATWNTNSRIAAVKPKA